VGRSWLWFWRMFHGDVGRVFRRCHGFGTVWGSLPRAYVPGANGMPPLPRLEGGMLIGRGASGGGGVVWRLYDPLQRALLVGSTLPAGAGS
jgi:hypothetical protein